MNTSAIEEAPNVVSEEGLRILLEGEYLMEVTCTTSADKRHNTWFGRWIVHAVARDGSERKLLVVSRTGAIRAREFKTIVGFFSYILGHGFRPVVIPVEEGQSVTYDPADRSGHSV